MSNVTHLRARQDRRDFQSLRKRAKVIGDALETGRAVARDRKARETYTDPQPSRKSSFLDDCIIRVSFWDGLIAGLVIGIAGTLALINPGQ